MSVYAVMAVTTVYAAKSFTRFYGPDNALIEWKRLALL
jgi:hypothetical protein